MDIFKFGECDCINCDSSSLSSQCSAYRISARRSGRHNRGVSCIGTVSSCYRAGTPGRAREFYRHRPFNLSSIAHAFPFLESLTLDGLYAYEGSLNDTNLKSLVIRISDESAVNSSLVPFKSARTLVRLCIINAGYTPFRGTNPFDSLVNLTDLELVPPVDDFWQLLSTTKIKLLHFTIDIASQYSIKEVLTMFSSPCFQQLQSLTLNRAKTCIIHRTYRRNSEEIITAITRHLRSLRTIELYTAIEISWCSSFVHLINLKSLRCVIQKDSDDEPSLTSVEGCDWEEFRAKAMKEFQRIFANFEQKPHVTIDFNCQFDDKYYFSEISQLGSAHNLHSRIERE